MIEGVLVFCGLMAVGASGVYGVYSVLSDNQPAVQDDSVTCVQGGLLFEDGMGVFVAPYPYEPPPPESGVLAMALCGRGLMYHSAGPYGAKVANQNRAVD